MDIDKDFSRNVWCLLGIPFDAITIKQTATEITSAVNEKKTCFLSTPNLNYLCASQTDFAFRESVIDSDLSVADGFPIVLSAQLLGIPLPERVAGSSLMDYLFNQKTNSPIKIFFFGGEPGAGEKASQNVNQNSSGLHAVGHFAPGFGSVDEMSTPEIIDDLNQHEIGLLNVSISAKKGQAWIVKNRHLLKATVISHLGAVINFFAGTVKRAPIFVQRFGLEWLWRIYQEPSLWRRYYNDGVCFLGLLLCNVIPYWYWLKTNKTTVPKESLDINTSGGTENATHISLTGICTNRTIAPLRNVFMQVATEKRDVVLDLEKVVGIDSAFLGLCLVLYKHLKASGNSVKLINPDNNVSRILKWQKVDDLFY